MTPEKLAQAARDFEEALTHHAANANAPIGQAEAAALRDRMKSLMNMISGQAEALSKIDEAVHSLRPRVDDADETRRQLNFLATKVNDMAVMQATIDARLKVVEERLGIVNFNESAVIFEKKSRAKKTK